MTMRPDVATMIDRVAAVRQRARGGRAEERLLAEIEYTLSEGYAQALAGDAWSMRSEQRLHDLIDNRSSSMRGGRELRTLANEHAVFQQDVVALRCELAQLRKDRDRVHAGSHATSR